MKKEDTAPRFIKIMSLSKIHTPKWDPDIGRVSPQLFGLQYHLVVQSLGGKPKFLFITLKVKGFSFKNLVGR